MLGLLQVEVVELREGVGLAILTVALLLVVSNQALETLALLLVLLQFCVLFEDIRAVLVPGLQRNSQQRSPRA